MQLVTAQHRGRAVLSSPSALRVEVSSPRPKFNTTVQRMPHGRWFTVQSIDAQIESQIDLALSGSAADISILHAMSRVNSEPTCVQSPAGSQNPEGGPYVASNRWAAALPRALALGFFWKGWQWGFVYAGNGLFQYRHWGFLADIVYIE